MKQLLLSILLLSAFPIATRAQELSYDIEVGMAVGKQVPRYDATSSWGIGIRAGGNVHYTLPCQVVLSSGLLFEQKRTELDGKTSYSPDINTGWDRMRTKVHRLNYLQLPLLAGYNIDCGRGVTVCPQIGFFVDYGKGFIRTDGIRFPHTHMEYRDDLYALKGIKDYDYFLDADDADKADYTVLYSQLYTLYNQLYSIIQLIIQYYTDNYTHYTVDYTHYTDKKQSA